MTVIFKAKTREGYVLKILAELLQSNIKINNFIISNTGINLRTMDSRQTILIDLELQADNFVVYQYKPVEKMYIGINPAHFHKMLKTIKKRDSIEFFINDDNITDLGIKVIPKENNRITTSFIKIQNSQNLDIGLPEGYGKPVIVPSGEFQKMTKGLSHISNETHISSKGFLIRFSSESDGVLKRCTEFGEIEDSDQESDDNKDSDYEDKFETEQLTRITKLAGLSSTMQIYSKTSNPLLFKSSIGTLGKISIYLKSKSLQDIESRSTDKDE